MKGKPLTLEDVVLYGRDPDGSEWKIEADEVVIDLKRNGTFLGRFRMVKPWGKCQAKIIHMVYLGTVWRSP